MANNEEQLPREFGKYYLIEKIAVGGMAELFRAKLYGAGGFEKDLAIKKVLPQLASDASFVQMFMDEAMITVTLNHGNIVSVIDFGELDGEFFLVMEYIDGVDLQSLINQSRESGNPIPVPIACYIALNICRGLDYAHRKVGPDGRPLQIIHRDVSPQNVLISFEGTVKLLDFGIARAASRITATQAGMVKGKLAYMSPEQLTGQNIDMRSDIFSAGIILYEMLTNQRPFEGATPQETMAAINRGSYQKPQKLNKKVDKKLTSVIRKALERSPKKRYHSAGEMAHDLSGYLHHIGLDPDAATLAAFIPKRLPEARPRTVPPTPIRAIRRSSDSQPGTFPAANPSQGPLPGSFPPPNAESVMVNDGEAVSFDMLDLPQYEQELVKVAESYLSAGDPEKAPAQSEEKPVSQQEAANLAAHITGPLGQPAAPPASTPPPGACSPTGDSAREPAAQPESVTTGQAPATAAEPAGTQPPEKPSQAQPPGEPSAAQPPEEPAAAQPPEEPATTQPPGEPATEQPPGKPAAAQPPGEPATEQPPEAAATEQPPGEPAAAQPPAQTTGEPAGATPTADGAAVLNDEVVADMWERGERPPEVFTTDSMRAAAFPRRRTGLKLLLGVFLIALLAGAAVWYLYWSPWAGYSNEMKPKEPDQPLAASSVPAVDPQPPPPEKPAAAPVESPQAATADGGAETAGVLEPALVPPPATLDAGPAETAPEPARTPDATEVTKKPEPEKPKTPKPRTEKPAVEKPKPEKPVARKPKPKKKRKKKRRRKRRRRIARTTPASGKKGTLRLNSEPFAVIYWGKRKLGPTPQMNIKLPAGSHTLTLKNEALGLSKRIRVRIEPGKVHTLFVELKK